MSTATFVEVVQHLRPGGIERLALDLVERPPLGGAGLLVSLEGDRDSALAAWPALARLGERLVFAAKKPGLDAALPLRLARLLRRRGAGFVHSHHLGPLLYAGLAARLAPGIAWVHTEHDAWHLQDPRQAALTRRCLRLLRPRTTAVAEAVAEGMAQATGRRPDVVIRNGIDTLRFRPGDRDAARARLGLPAHAAVVGIAGRLEREKNQALAIRALARMDTTDAVLALAGNGSLAGELRDLAAAEGVADRVRFLGHVEDMPAFYGALDAFCLPSLSEGLPLSLLEAQACGIASVATDVGGCREAICPESGAVVPSGDADALAAAWRTLLGRPAGRAPRDFAVAHGCREAMLCAYREIFS